MLAQLKKWWHTDCAFCRKARYTLLWVLLMFLADYYVFHLIF